MAASFAVMKIVLCAQQAPGAPAGKKVFVTPLHVWSVPLQELMLRCLVRLARPAKYAVANI